MLYYCMHIPKQKYWVTTWRVLGIWEFCLRFTIEVMKSPLRILNEDLDSFALNMSQGSISTRLDCSCLLISWAKLHSGIVDEAQPALIENTLIKTKLAYSKIHSEMRKIFYYFHENSLWRFQLYKPTAL